jgi:RimJ/RimL family protein N-acetyltransferase
MIELVPVHKQNIHLIEEWLNEDKNLRILGRLREDKFSEKDRDLYTDRNKTWTFIVYSGIVPVGYARLTHDKEGIAEIGIVLTASHRKQGIGFEVAQSLIRLAKKLKKKRVIWITAEFNDPSIKLAEKLGFRSYMKHLDAVKIDEKKFHRLVFVKELV